MNSSAFSSLPLKQVLLDNLQSLEFTAMTPIQAKSLPLILEGKDVIAQAKTGSGKTAAFGLAILSKLRVEQFTTQALIICPTRELVEQVAKEMRRLARLMNNVKVLTLFGGVPLSQQISSLEHDAHIIVATPGRLLDHLRQRRLDLSQLHTLVLDEADRMLDMGFEEDINQIIASTPDARQTLLFSATYPDTIMAMSCRIQSKPEFVSVDEINNEIEQHFYEIKNDWRNQALAKLLTLYPCESTIVFCNTRADCLSVESYLNELGFSACALHGDMEQKERHQALLQFANKSRAILVATDIAARGLDIKELDVVVNYQITPDPEVHIHRVGRTGRAGAKGVAITLIAANEIHKAHMIEDYQDTKIVWQSLNNLTLDHNNITIPKMQTVRLALGRKDKIRPGDVLGALTKDAGLKNQDIGKINIMDTYSYVALDRKIIKQALSYLQQGKIKGKTVKARKV